MSPLFGSSAAGHTASSSACECAVLRILPAVTASALAGSIIARSSLPDLLEHALFEHGELR